MKLEAFFVQQCCAHLPGMQEKAPSCCYQRFFLYRTTPPAPVWCDVFLFSFFGCLLVLLLSVFLHSFFVRNPLFFFISLSVFVFLRRVYNRPPVVHMKNRKLKRSCEIELFLYTHICKLGVIQQQRYFDRARFTGCVGFRREFSTIFCTDFGKQRIRYLPSMP